MKHHHPIDTLEPVVNPEQILDLRSEIWDINVDQTVEDFLIRLVDATRNHREISLGASPRATLALYKTSQALAAIQNRDHVLPDDIKYLAIPVLSHRLKLKPEAELRGRTSIDIIKQILSETPLKLSDQDRKGD